MKLVKPYILIILLLVVFSENRAQDRFIHSGTIEYERKVNLHRKMEGFWGEFKKEFPQFISQYFNLEFQGGKSIYQPGRESQQPFVNTQFLGPAMDNVIFMNLPEHRLVSNKSIFEDRFLIEDSLRNYTWKIESETREIAGFQCRKAITVICDSVYVVAFYTDEILFPGGPESFHGLPGMILGLAVPRMYTTWFATKVSVRDAAGNPIEPPRKGKKTPPGEMAKLIESSLGRWGNWGQKAIWQITL